MSVRRAVFPEDAAAVSRLLEAYLRQTEREKVDRGLATDPGDGMLPARYQREVDDPATATAGAAVYLAFPPAVDAVHLPDAEAGPAPAEAAGILIAVPASGPAAGPTAGPTPDEVELKRLWVEPVHRASGLGRALLEAAAAGAPEKALRLSVWAWRTDALRAYERAGFLPSPSWEERPQLTCLTRPAPAP
ncbi:GNAT family N-acetyltransferase [Herbiconiux moechotypicola]|uniref:N-acetyltransferase domain-containing protein n=1 Tax=Herbiconiux moechotypicola TaxID=637393 RepID=A0ABP5Q777_9MICO|nr:GNAT family N-acetyltransferase [Herbiconiux moechotypicola]MCS5729146.1 GNAT family N-acetyltransferase [Herbiconiux moechotypicola]